MRRDWRWLGPAALAALLALSPPLANFNGALGADEVVAKATDPKPADVAALPANLQKLFAGAAPGSVAELKAMQSHVQKLVEQLKKCTVGVSVGNAQGSGVIISKDGYVLTAAHVAGGPNRTNNVSLTLADGREVPAKTLGLFRTLDAGLMKITAPGEYPFAEMGSSENLKDGQWCLALGHPGGYQAERGMVLRLGRVLLNASDAITTDCTLVGGDSGGPLFDMDGRVIGINSRIGEQLTTNMHVPVSTYTSKDVWTRLNKGDDWGHLPGQEPWLGVKGAENAKDALIAEVVPNSPAAQAGIKAGDVIVSYDGVYIRDFAALKAKVAEWRPGRRGPPSVIQVLRDGEVIELGLRLRPRE